MTIQDLKDQGLILLECISGSKAYGLDTPTSDTDIKGVFYLPKDKFYGLEYIAQVNNETNDEVYYELGRFTELLVRNNPNILQLLATPAKSVLYRHPLMDRFSTDLFLSKLCRDTFAGYAMTQIRKARGFKKKIVNPVDAERKSILDFCFVIADHSSIPLKAWLQERGYRQELCGLSSIPHAKGLYAVFYDAGNSLHYKGISSGDMANEVVTSSIPAGTQQQGYLYFNLEAYSSYCREYREYWDWVEKRNEERYKGNMAHGRDYDAKNMMHTIRLLEVALEILRDGQLNVLRSNRKYLLSIKSGTWSYEALIETANDLMDGIESAYERSSLPDAPDRKAVEALLIGMRNELYQ